MDYEQYLQDRLNGMYEVLESSDNVLLEGFKRKKDEKATKEIKIHSKRFINYLEWKYSNKNIRHEIRAAETPAEKEALVKKYMNDYREWKKRDKFHIGFAITQVVLTGLSVSGKIKDPIFIITGLLLLGGYILDVKHDMKIKNDVAYEKYKKQKEDK